MTIKTIHSRLSNRARDRSFGRMRSITIRIETSVDVTDVACQK